MKKDILIIAASTLAAALVLVPHSPPTAESFKPRTLAGIYLNVLADAPARWNGERIVLLLLLFAGIFAGCFPLVLLPILRWRHFGVGAAGVMLGVLALVAATGAITNGLLIILNQSSFTFGGRQVPGEAIAFAAVVTIIQLTFAILNFATAVSSRWAAFLS